MLLGNIYTYCRFAYFWTCIYIPYFEHHVNKGFSKPTTYKLINLVHKDVFRLINGIKKLKIVCLHGVQNKVYTCSKLGKSTVDVCIPFGNCSVSQFSLIMFLKGTVENNLKEICIYAI